jgi:hypothetical protein
MNRPSYEPPTPAEWAKAVVIVIKEGEPPIIGLRKNVTKNGVPYSQTVWLTVTQLRGLAIEETF